MDTDTIESRGVQPLLNVLKAMGGWPLLEGSAWDGRDFKWYSLVWRFRQLGYSVDYLLGESETSPPLLTSLFTHLRLLCDG